MKSLPSILALVLLAACSCAAQEPVTFDETNSAHTYTPQEFMRDVGPDTKDGTLIRIKFNWREDRITSAPRGMMHGTIEDRNLGTGLQVLIPAGGVKWFQHVNTFNIQSWDRVNVKSYLVYARTIANAKGGATVRLVGTEVQHDLDGDKIVWNQGPGGDPTP